MTRKNKPRKEQAVNNFHSMIAKSHAMIEQCGVNPADISSWATEPWSYKSITAATKWFNSFMEPVVNDMTGFLLRFPPSYFRLLLSNHPDVTTLRQKKRNVAEVWHKRPRFKDERGRSKGGY